MSGEATTRFGAGLLSALRSGGHDVAPASTIRAGESMLALAADVKDGLLAHDDVYYAVENFARHGMAYERVAVVASPDDTEGGA